MIAYDSPALAKLSQVAKGTKTCNSCGANRDLGEFVQPWGSGFRNAKNCLKCRSEIRTKAGQTKRRTHEALRKVPVSVPKVLSSQQQKALKVFALKMEMHVLATLSEEALQLRNEFKRILENLDD